MDAAHHFQISIVTLVCAVAALFFSLLAAFPGLKDILVAIRDGVLWFALFVVLGGVGFVVWQHFRQPAGITTAYSANHAGHLATQRTPPKSP